MSDPSSSTTQVPPVIDPVREFQHGSLEFIISKACLQYHCWGRQSENTNFDFLNATSDPEAIIPPVKIQQTCQDENALETFNKKNVTMPHKANTAPVTTSKPQRTFILGPNKLTMQLGYQ